MIDGFEEYTKDLSDWELQVARKVWNYFNRIPGWSTNKQIRENLKQNGVNIDGSRFRKIMNWLHLHGHLPNLVASNKGYKIAESREELKKYIQSLDQRIKPIEARKKMAQKDLNNFN